MLGHVPMQFPYFGYGEVIFRGRDDDIGETRKILLGCIGIGQKKVAMNLLVPIFLRALMFAYKPFLAI